MSAANNIHAMYGHTNFDAAGTGMYVRAAYANVNRIMKMSMISDKRYCSELNTEGHAKFSTN